MTDDCSGISVVICVYTFDRWPDIVEAIDSVRRQTRQAEQVILVVDHNSALLAHAQASFSDDVHVVANRGANGLSGARNTGIAEATGALIAFLDDDAIAEPNWLAVGAEVCADPDVLGVSGWVEPLWQSPRPSWFPEEFLWTLGCSYRGLRREQSEVRNLMGGVMIIKREVFAAAGGFNSRLGRSGGSLVSCEETELCIRARAAYPTGRFMTAPTSRIHHKIPPSRLRFSYFVRRCWAEGTSKARLAMLAPRRDALDVERSYVLRTLTSGILIGLRDCLGRGNLDGIRRAGAITAGVGAAMLAFVAERLRHQGWSEPAPLQQRTAE